MIFYNKCLKSIYYHYTKSLVTKVHLYFLILASQVTTNDTFWWQDTGLDYSNSHPTFSFQKHLYGTSIAKYDLRYKLKYIITIKKKCNLLTN